MAQTRHRAPLWLDGLGEWSWPGLAPAVELAPAAWVPAAPVTGAAPMPRTRGPAAGGLASGRTQVLRRRIAAAVALTLLGVASTALFAMIARPAQSAALTAPAMTVSFTSQNPFAVDSGAQLAARVAGSPTAIAAFVPPLPTLALGPLDGAGSAIGKVTYTSAALGHHDTFLVYTPPGFTSASTRRYPVLYLLHGRDQSASSFLRLGLRDTLDRLISTHKIAPMIAVMLQAGGRTENWRDNVHGNFASYVTEVRRLVDQMLPTVTSRAGRGIAGYSMGGFGAMHAALGDLRSFSVVESWEGFFDGLSGTLAADRPLLAKLPLHVFVYGGISDRIADPAEDMPWVAALTAAGADASGAIYPGDHTFTPLASHMEQMMLFAGRALSS